MAEHCVSSSKADVQDKSHRSLTGTPDDVVSSTKGSSASYRDFSRVPPTENRHVSAVVAQGAAAKEPTFPVKLHMILSNPEFQDIISWLPHGRSWRILQQKAFEERVIPMYFRHGRYSSFARQVNGWGFRRITHGSDYNSYYHELFLRGMPHLCDKMRRLTSKDISQKKSMEEEAAPDFYALSREHPLPEKNQSAEQPKQEALSSPKAVPSSPVISAQPLSRSAAGSSGQPIADVELALLERRRADILGRMNSLASARGLPTGPGLASLAFPETPSFGALPPLIGSSLIGPGTTGLDLLRQRREAQLMSSDMSKLLGIHDLGLGGFGGLPPSTLLGGRHFGGI